MRFGELIIFLLFLSIVIINIIARAVRISLRNRKNKKTFEKDISEREPTKTHVKSEKIGDIQKEYKEYPTGSIYKEGDLVSKEVFKELRAREMAKVGYSGETIITILPEKQPPTPEPAETVGIERTPASPIEKQFIAPEVKPLVREEKLQESEKNMGEIVREGSVWERINRLSQLRKAVIFSEILGKPRGLE